MARTVLPNSMKQESKHRCTKCKRISDNPIFARPAYDYAISGVIFEDGTSPYCSDECHEKDWDDMEYASRRSH